MLDCLLTWGGTAGVIAYNYIVPDNTIGFKVTFTGICLLVAMVFTAKYVFERFYQKKMDNLLQQLATATDENVKAEINKSIEAHKIKLSVYQRLMMMLPILVLFIVCFLGEVSLHNLKGTCIMILLSMGFGSIFNALKTPLANEVKMQKFVDKANNK